MKHPWTTPAPLGAALSCMDVKAGIMVIGLILLDMLLYYPFFKLTEKQKLQEEAEKLIKSIELINTYTHLTTE